MAKIEEKRKRNRVKESLDFEAKSMGYLARKAGIAPQTLKRVINEKGNTAQLTKNKIVRGFNEFDNKKRDYTEDYLFPDG